MKVTLDDDPEAQKIWLAFELEVDRFRRRLEAHYRKKLGNLHFIDGSKIHIELRLEPIITVAD